MIKRFLSIAILLLAVLTGLRAQLNWQKTNGPTGCNVLDFAQDSTGKIWAVTGAELGHQLIRSTDDGASWAELNIPFFDDKSVSTMEVGANGYIYVLDDSFGFYRSTDGGTTWASQNIDSTGGLATISTNLAFLPDGSLLLLGQKRLLKSVDFGQNWSLVEQFPNVDQLASVRVMADSLIFVGGVDPQSQHMVWRSADGGQTFAQVIAHPAPFNSDCVFMDMELVGNTLVMLGASGVLRSLDGGLNWAFSYQNAHIWHMQKGADDKLFLFDVWTENFLKSEDAGVTWTGFGTAPDGKWLYDNFLLTQNGTFIFSAFKLFRSTDTGANWAICWEGTQPSGAIRIGINPATASVFTLGAGVHKSTNAGQSWEWTHQSYLNSYHFDIFKFSETGDLYLQMPNGLIHTADDGTTWDTIYPGSSGQQALQAVAVAPSGRLFAHMSSLGLLTSTDKGAIWVTLTSATSNPTWLLAPNDSLLFCHIEGNIPVTFRSINGGQSWSQLAPVSSPPLVGGIHSDSYHMSKWGELFAEHEYKLYRSSDLGDTWTKVNVDYPYMSRIITTASGQIYLLDAGAYILYSDDFGLSWVNVMPYAGFGDPLGNNFIQDIALSEGNALFAAAGDGVWRTDDVSPFYAKLSGNIKKDENSDCAVSPGDLSLENWTVTATGTSGSTSYASTDATGHYLLGHIVGDTATVNLQVEAHAPNYLWAICDSVLTATVSQQIDTANHLDFSATADIDCALIDVSINFWPARPCSTLTIVANYCNVGSIIAADAKISVAIDPLITVNSTSLPIFSQSGDTLTFSLGNVGIGACGSVSIVGTLSCDAVLGQSICVHAHASPDSLCGSFPDWSGAYLLASAKCAGDSLVELSVKNIGKAASTSNLDYIVIEDQILLKTGKLQSLTPGQSMLLSEMPDGKTLRIEAEQEPGHPLSNYTAAWVEGCGNNPPSWGWILPFLGEDGDPFTATYCREVTTSFDPNAKEALPAGFGAAHFIRPGQPLEYNIQFQNTGNDTAFLVVLRDTLDAGLDPATIRMGASSHPMEWEIYGPGILKFVFKNILLPDSTTNEPASHGWASFNIEQRAGLPLGTVIRNKAGIYFDANAPVLTNETWHTLGENFLPLAVQPSPESAAVLSVSPNPMGESAIFELKNGEKEGIFTLKIMDSAGRTVRVDMVVGPRFEVFRKGLPAGLWFFSLEKPDGGPVVAHGKLLAR